MGSKKVPKKVPEKVPVIFNIHALLIIANQSLDSKLRCCTCLGQFLFVNVQ